MNVVASKKELYLERSGDNLSCIFCNMEKEKIIIENEAAYAVFDIFPVSNGHMLIIPKTHIRDYFEAVLTCTDVGAGKDEPVIFRKAGQLLGTAKEDTIVIEDALYAVKTAKEDGVEVINYDRMITNTDAVSYLATFDNTVVGEKQGEYIVDKLDLENTDQTFNLEIVSGDPGDNNATYFYNGAMSILQPYIDSGKLVVKSGQVSKDDTATANWDTEKAQSRMDAIIASYYADGTNLDAVLCSNDSTALGTANALESSYTGSWPIITGQDCDIANVKNIVKGKQTMSVFKDTRKLAKVTVKMVNSIMKGEEVEVNDTITYDNGAKVIPTYVVDPIAVDQDNYKEILIEGGYYTEAELQ